MLTLLNTLYDDHQHVCTSNHVDVILYGAIELLLCDDFMLPF